MVIQSVYIISSNLLIGLLSKLFTSWVFHERFGGGTRGGSCLVVSGLVRCSQENHEFMHILSSIASSRPTQTAQDMSQKKGGEKIRWR